MYLLANQTLAKAFHLVGGSPRGHPRLLDYLQHNTHFAQVNGFQTSRRFNFEMTSCFSFSRGVREFRAIKTVFSQFFKAV